MIKVVNVKAKKNYVLELTFNDGVKGEVCIKDSLFGVMFEPLQDVSYFNQVSIDEFGVICWPNEADLDSTVLYNKIRSLH